MPATPTDTSVFSTPLPVSREALAGWHRGRGAFARLVPPWKRVDVLEPPSKLEAGTRVVLRLREGPTTLRWVARITEVGEGGFVDEQESGPFGAWRHEHRFLACPDGTSVLEDRIAWAPPGGIAGRMVLRGFVREDLRRVFTYRHAVTRDDLAREAEFAAIPGGRSPAGFRVLVAGATGLLGRRLVPLLQQLGAEVKVLTRKPRAEGEIAWDPDRGVYPSAKSVAGFDAVVNLAGAGIADGRWTEARRAAILRSRVEATAGLVARLIDGGGVTTYVTASGVGGTASSGGPWSEGEGPPATGFLADVVRAWEAASAPLAAEGTRVVALRFGAVLSPGGGALAKMLPAFMMGLGGRIGSGKQAFPWIGIDDAADIAARALLDPALSGVVHAVAPGRVDQAAFARTLAAVLGRPAILPMPAAVVRLIFGDLGDEVLLSGQQAVPSKLLGLGHRWRHPDLGSALRHLLGR